MEPSLDLYCMALFHLMSLLTSILHIQTPKYVVRRRDCDFLPLLLNHRGSPWRSKRWIKKGESRNQDKWLRTGSMIAVSTLNGSWWDVPDPFSDKVHLRSMREDESTENKDFFFSLSTIITADQKDVRVETGGNWRHISTIDQGEVICY